MSTQTFGQRIFLLRVDCEHVESLRWAGTVEPEVAGTPRLLSLLDELAVPATFAFVGLTAQHYPALARAAMARGHAVAGHSLDHAQAYAGRSRPEQETDIREMAAAIEAACGVRVRGLAAPCHGLIDTATLQAAARAGLDYVLNFSVMAEVPILLAPAPEINPPVLVPTERLKVVWDWTALQPGWPLFSAADAMREWTAAIDEVSQREGGGVSLIVHPWIVELNQEYAVLTDLLRYARDKGFTFSTFDHIARAVVAKGRNTAAPAVTETAV
jgi:peptidoglycan/xylan/chitin deacetylase (PgdA/CDA1 family)